MLEFITTYWTQVWALLSVLFIFATFALRKTYASQTQVDALELRVIKIESDIKQLPTNKDLHQLDRQIVEVGTKLDALSGQLLKIQRMTEMLVENELQGDKK